MYKITLTLKNDPRFEAKTIQHIDLALAYFDQCKAYYSDIKRLLNIQGEYTLTLSTEGHNILRSEAI